MQKSIFRISLLLLFFMFVKAEGQSQAIAPVLEFQELTFDKDSILKRFAPLNPLVQDYKIYCMGETHSVISNPALHFDMFIYLYHQAGVRYFVMEGNYTYVYFIDRYVQTGNEEYLEKAQNSTKTVDDFYNQGYTPPQEITKAERELDSVVKWVYKSLYQFNSTLPEKEKIKIFSIDTELFFDASLLEDILPKDSKIPDEIKPIIDDLLKIKRTNFGKYLRMDLAGGQKAEDIVKKIKMAREHFQKYRSLYRDYLGRNFQYFDNWLNNQASLYRSDKNLFGNFTRISKELGHGNYFFRYGSLHTRFKEGWLSWFLQNKSQFKGKVFNFMPQYVKCGFWFNSPKIFENHGILSNLKEPRNPKNKKEEILARLRQSVSQNFSIFDLSKTDFGKLKKLGQVFILIQNQQYRNY